MEVNSEFSCVIAEITSNEGEDVSVGDVIGKLDENGEAGASSGKEESKAEETDKNEKAPKEEPKQDSAEESKQEAAPEQNNGDVIASPAARKRARELGIDLSEVQTRDPLGRVRPDDVNAHNNAPKKESAPSKPEKKKNLNQRKQSLISR